MLLHGLSHASYLNRGLTYNLNDQMKLESPISCARVSHGSSKG